MGTVGPKIGFGPRWLQPWLRKIKKCSERTVDGCEPGAVDGCCTVIPCKLCLKWEEYGEDIEYGSAEWDGAQWTGTVGDLAFVAYWRRDYDDGCRFVVEVNGDVVAEFEKCYDVTCRDPSGEIGLTIGYDSGILRWEVYRQKELPLTTEDGCVVKFCGDCDCTCSTLCVTITKPYGIICQGELDDDSYPSDCPSAPVWGGEVDCDGDTYSIGLSLARNDYTGECVLGGTISGYEIGESFDLDDHEIGDCRSLSASWTLDDGTVMSVRCNVCGICGVNGEICCPDRTCPGDDSGNPLPNKLGIELSDPSPEGCFEMEGELTLLSCESRTWAGTLTGSCTWCDQTFEMRVDAIVTCNAHDGWLLAFQTSSPAGDCGGVPPDTVLNQSLCDPILLSGDIECFVCPQPFCEVPDPPNPPNPQPHDPFCLSVLVYEMAT